MMQVARFEHKQQNKQTGKQRLKFKSSNFFAMQTIDEKNRKQTFKSAYEAKKRSCGVSQ